MLAATFSPAAVNAGRSLGVGGGHKSAPELLEPADGTSTTNLKPTFSWTGSSSDTYRIQITTENDNGFDSPVVDLRLGGTSYQRSSTLEWQTYRWRVRQEKPVSDWSQVWSFTVTPSLSENDELTLNSNLETLSSGWDQEAVDSANSILSKSEYTAGDWQNYFQTFFNTTEHAYTNELRNYLVYPTFYWFGDDVHQRLQTGLSQPLFTKTEAPMAEYPFNLSEAMANDQNLRQSIFNSHKFFAEVAQEGAVGETQLDNIYQNYRSLILDYPQYLSAEVTFDTASEPYLASLRAQIWMSFRDIKPSLDSATKDDIADTLGLSGRYLDIWNLSSTLLHDNNQFSLAQKDVIYDVISGTPASILTVNHITQNDFLGNTGDQSVGLLSKNSVNVFPYEVGSWQENSFPSDIAPLETDVFSIGLVHELNHLVDAYYINPDSELSIRKDELLNQAGSVDLQYLRSQIGADYFQQHPQEFVASISNEWFTGSKHTLDLALQRFDQEYTEPLNQFLFFAEVYSADSDYTSFYRLDTSGALTVEQAPVSRDSSGNITSLTYNNQTYNFTFDSNGNVTGYTVQ